LQPSNDRENGETRIIRRQVFRRRNILFGQNAIIRTRLRTDREKRLPRARNREIRRRQNIAHYTLNLPRDVARRNIITRRQSNFARNKLDDNTIKWYYRLRPRFSVRIRLLRVMYARRDNLSIIARQ